VNAPLLNIGIVGLGRRALGVALPLRS